MTQDQKVQRILALAKDHNYTAINVDCDDRAIGRKAERWSVSVQVPYQGRIVIATGTSFAKCYAQAVAYLTA